MPGHVENELARLGDFTAFIRSKSLCVVGKIFGWINSTKINMKKVGISQRKWI